MLNSGLIDVQERRLQDERRRALRALLARPLLGSEHAAFILIRRHVDWLREWFGRETGWPLLVDSEYARLVKRPADTKDSSRPARVDFKTSNPAFSRRRYCLLCLALATLERGEQQTTLGRLGESLVAAATEPSLIATGIRFELTQREERRDLVAVVRLLLNLKVLKRVAGDEDAFVSETGDVLYDVNRQVMANLLVTTRGPSLVAMTETAGNSLDEYIAAIGESFIAETVDARNQALRQRLTRRLLDDPLVYWQDLSEDELNYLGRQRGAITRRIEEATGLIAEIRAEGMAMVDMGSDLSDVKLPTEGTEGHATLLLAEYLAQQIQDNDNTNPSIALDELHRKMRQWVKQHRQHWRKSAREAGGEVELCRHAIDSLVALRLVRRTSEGIQPLPALGRFALLQPESKEASGSTPTPISKSSSKNSSPTNSSK